MNTCSKLALVIALGAWLAPVPAAAGETVEQRLDRLERENKELRRDVETLTRERAPAQRGTPNNASTDSPAPPPPQGPLQQQARREPPPPLRPSQSERDSGRGFVEFNNDYSYAMFDPTKAGKDKPRDLLEAKRAGKIDKSGIVLGAAVTAIADYQQSNRTDKFGYLMRQPGQVGDTVTEAALHSVQVGITGNINSWISAYAEILYDPMQSFGGGSLTDLNRNQLTLRKGYVLIGDLDWAPVYLQIGKIETPFGQTDTVNPFTLSTDFHAFGGLSYGALVSWSNYGFTLTAEAAQGGAQFRGLNSLVHGTNVPSELNNYVLDANYLFKFGQPDRNLLVGASYEGSSSYCTGFPIVHFGTCEDENPAWAAYATLHWDAFTLRGEYMTTVDEWPGTFNPNPPLDAFAAHDVVSWDVGGKYRVKFLGRDLDISADYSILIAGPDGSPWERQDQLVGGLAYYIMPNAKLFTEVVLIRGFEPLQFLTGGIPSAPPNVTAADSDARSEVFLVGGNVAF